MADIQKQKKNQSSGMVTSTGEPAASSEPGSPDALIRALESHFGFSSFRPLQREIIESVLSGKHAIGILPTGSGKSVCYQLPALILPGTTLVISPLISLMKDQVDGLLERGIKAMAITSHDTAAEYREKLQTLSSGQAKLVFVAPERLANESFLAACSGARISLLAVDEAHCVSQWGHDFRPEYRQIPDFHAKVGKPVLLALTATAQPRVQADLARGLGLEGATLFKASVDRPNLWIGVEHCATQAERRGLITSLISGMGEGSAIVYATSRNDTEELAEHLYQRLQGSPLASVACYHAGLSPEARTGVQNRFMNGFLRVVVATNAFGMGIDKADIRLVIHAGVPDSLEAYYQEIGRAGRDGKPARCLMALIPGSDVKRREFLLRDNPDRLAQERFRIMKNWVWLEGECRRGHLLRYFGEPARSRDETCCSTCHPLELEGRADLARLGPESRKKKKSALAGTGASGGAGAGGRSGTGVAAASTLGEALAELLFEELRTWRAERALAAEVPAFVVFGDRDLLGIAHAAPASMDELAACRGVGPHKLKAYGQPMLDIILAFRARSGIVGSPAGSSGTPGRAGTTGTGAATRTADSPGGAGPDVAPSIPRSGLPVTGSLPARSGHPAYDDGASLSLAGSGADQAREADSGDWPPEEGDMVPTGHVVPGRQDNPVRSAPATAPGRSAVVGRFDSPVPSASLPASAASARLVPKPERLARLRECANLVAQGQDLDALARHFSLGTSTIWGWLAEWVELAPDDSWKPIPRAFAGREAYQTISAEFARQNWDGGLLRPIRDALGENQDWNQLKIAAAVWLYRDPKGPGVRKA